MRTLLACLLAVTCGSCNFGPATSEVSERAITLETSVGRNDGSSSLKVFAEKIKPLHSALREPQPGDWLTEHEESGQTFDQYVLSRKTRAGDAFRTLYVQPLGEFSSVQTNLLSLTADYLGRFYRLPVKTLEPVSLADLPEEARRVHPQWGGEQILTTHLLYQVLKPRRPADAVAVLGLTATDLWPGKGWNFVFGQASLTERVGVWSLARYGNPAGGEEDFRLCLRRTLGTASHETGHMLGFQHCIAYECGMNGTNNLPESDRKPLDFCPECLQKVWWTCRVDPSARYQTLTLFAEKNGLGEEARFWRESLGILKD